MKFDSIEVITLLIIFQSINRNIAANSNWMPQKFDQSKLVACGKQLDYYGFSLIDKYFYQFESKCSVIIYPLIANQLTHFIDQNNQQQQLRLSNGYRFEFNELQQQHPKSSSVMNKFCKNNKSSMPFDLNDSQYTLIRLHTNHDWNNKILLYYYYHYESNKLHYLVLNTDDSTDKIDYEQMYLPYINPSIRFIMINDRYTGQIFIIHNDVYTDDNHDLLFRNDLSNQIHYQLIKDPLIHQNGHIGFICIGRQAANQYVFVIKLQTKLCKTWHMTNKLLNKINLAFKYDRYVYLISKQSNTVMIIDHRLISYQPNDNQEYPIQIRKLDDFFTCHEASTATTTASKATSATPATVTTPSILTSNKASIKINTMPMKPIIITVGNNTSLTMTDGQSSNTTTNKIMTKFQQFVWTKWRIPLIITLIILFDTICLCLCICWCRRSKSKNKNQVKIIVGKLYHASTPPPPPSSTTTTSTIDAAPVSMKSTWSSPVLMRSKIFRKFYYRKF